MQYMILGATTRWLSIAGLCLCISGCLGWFEGTSQAIGYVLDKGDANAIGGWTMKQTDARKIFDGLCGLNYRILTTHKDQEAQDGTAWYVLVVERIEDWPPDEIIPAHSGEQWTTRELIRQAFSLSEHSGVYSDDLLSRLRPSEKHAQWLQLWNESEANLELSQQDARDIAAGKPLKLPKPTTRESPQ